MQEFIVGCVCCWVGAIPFCIITFFNKRSNIPISFWAGDKIKNIADVEKYNMEMSRLYTRCAIILFISPFFILINIYIFIVLILMECSIGIYLVYLKYKKILSKYQE